MDIKGSHKSGEKMPLADAPTEDAKADGKGGAPNISQIWAVREFFVNIAGIALLTGICLLCVTSSPPSPPPSVSPTRQMLALLFFIQTFFAHL